ncbi:NAD dependent epimerase/dehydratase [Xylariomycetidae sp. FL0641]|nr:NAD dependent epimerase/dehydratase [Xylariomycetidae sp. FL0641]
MSKVLLTGGSGFIAAHVLDQLLQGGYEVVTTVRSEEKANKIRSAYPGAKLTVAIVEDLAKPDAFDALIAQHPDLAYVQHTASPFHYRWSDAKTELLDPAIVGTTSVLKAVAAHAPHVKRVVVTSSFAAILDAADLNNASRTFSEADWNPASYEDGLKGPAPVSYRVSKKFAERAAWDFVSEQKPSFDLATICPPLVFGPLAHPSHLASLAGINTSNERIADLLAGKWKSELPPTGVNLWVDVRDVARAHVRAMERADAGGKRFFTVQGYYSNRDIARIVRENFPDLKEKLPGEEVKGGEAPESSCGYDNSRATQVLGIEWTGLETCVKDTVVSLRQVGGS